MVNALDKASLSRQSLRYSRCWPLNLILTPLMVCVGGIYAAVVDNPYCIFAYLTLISLASSWMLDCMVV